MAPQPNAPLVSILAFQNATLVAIAHHIATSYSYPNPLAKLCLCCWMYHSLALRPIFLLTVEFGLRFFVVSQIQASFFVCCCFYVYSASDISMSLQSL